MARELRTLAEFVRDFDLDMVDENTRRAACFCVLDNLGAALGAAASGEIRSIAESYAKWCSPGSNGRTAAVWGQGRQADLFSALMVNGLMAHELELDDVHTLSKSHVGAVVVPAAWTVAEALNADGRSFLEAVILGYEVMSRVGMGMDVASNRRRGWHTTGVIGPFGAAAAAARLMGLTIEQTVSAFGMAGTQAAGLWAFLAEGASCKKLHPARAIVNGVSGCILAASGMTGPEHILDAEDGGLYAAVSDSFDMSKLTQNLGQDYQICRIDKKPYPCCRTTHHAIDAALKLRTEVDAENVESVIVETYDVGVLQCGFKKYPETPREAKFSIAFTCAMALVKGHVTSSDFTQASLDDPLIKHIAKNTSVMADEMFTRRYPKRWGSRMTVTLKDGSRHVCQIDDMSGSAAVPMSEKQERDKFMGLVEGVFSPERSEQLMEQILKADRIERLLDLS